MAPGREKNISENIMVSYACRRECGWGDQAEEKIFSYDQSSSFCFL